VDEQQGQLVRDLRVSCACLDGEVRDVLSRGAEDRGQAGLVEMPAITK
jgi:hypothetical protein